MRRAIRLPRRAWRPAHPRPYTFRGYYQSPAHNARVFDGEGFYCSGDLVVQDADGYLTVVGRQKDQINRGGEKIAAEEVENQLLHHPAITHAALVSMPDSAMGRRAAPSSSARILP